MRKVILIFFVALATLLMLSFVFRDRSREIHNDELKIYLDRLDHSDVDKDLPEAIKRKDYRFIAIVGLIDYCPGIENRDGSKSDDITSKYIEALGCKVVPVSSDVAIPDELNNHLMVVIGRYIKPYNRKLLHYLKKDKPFQKYRKLKQSH